MKKFRKSAIVSAAVPPELLIAIDEEAHRQRAERPGNDVTRSDVIREAVIHWLSITNR